MRRLLKIFQYFSATDIQHAPITPSPAMLYLLIVIATGILILGLHIMLNIRVIIGDTSAVRGEYYVQGLYRCLVIIIIIS